MTAVRMLPVLAAALLAVTPALGGAAAPAWRSDAPVPTPRTEVAAAVANGEVVVAGGFLADGSTTGVAEAYAPRTNRWRRLPDLPQAVNHAAGGSWRGRMLVAGGYTGDGAPTSAAWMLERGRWRPLPPLPGGRAAAAGAVAGDTFYVVGGVAASPLGRSLAREAFALHLPSRRWRTIPGPTPREHLAATAWRGRVYAVGGRLAGIDTNRAHLEAYDPASRRWRRLPPVPEARGGTGAAAIAGRVVSVGGEAPGGTLRNVYAYDVAARRWRRLADLPTARHGLGVVALGGRVRVLAGGPEPGLFVSGANESLAVP
jgi:N-acetylneuraminic acid mutarotase